MDAAELARRIEEARRQVAPLVPDIDPQDLVNLLENLWRPFGSGKRFFLREVRPGVHVI